MKKEFPVYLLLIFSLLFTSCENSDNGLAPYLGSTDLSTLNIEQNTFKPNITWVGGYASVFGVNRGTRASLDSSLVFLVKTDGNNLRYPLQFGSVPEGAASIISEYGGTPIDTLNEDETYTFWVLKEDVWAIINDNRNKKLVSDSLLSQGVIEVSPDSLVISTRSLITGTKPIDLFINISNISAALGRLGAITILPKLSNRPTITWKITEAGETDSLISAVGLVEGTQFNPLNEKWAVWSERDSSGTLLYGKDNIIRSPVVIGDSIPGTRTFFTFPETGLERGKDYYIWIANRKWDGKGRLRGTPGYAYITFSVR